MAAERYRFEPLADDHRRADFSCGVGALDHYFREQAGQDLRRRLAVPYVLLDSETGTVAGYYTLSSASMLPHSLPEHLLRRLPRYSSFPVTLIGRLAVDLRYRDQSLGERLLLDALRHCLDASREVAAMAVVVDAKDDAARAFYERYGFERFADHEYRLFLRMTTVAQLTSGRGATG
ncbi:MAG: GNAT family N-acetyltransferase [Chloroflexota bacterium]|nr:GNAT family N-acetyltransferase [Chloroflexota bacterium]